MSKENTELKGKIIDWLQKQGYPFEMSVARKFRTLGFNTMQSDYYKDIDTEVSREIDVTAYIQNEIDGVLIRTEFFIECKSARDKPWIILTSSDIHLADPARIVQRAASKLGQAFLKSVSRREDILKLPGFLIPNRAGYGLIQAFGDHVDVPYGAIMGAIKAAVAEVKAIDKSPTFSRRICLVSFPVVILDGSLYECYLNKDGEVIVEEAEIGTLLWRNPVVGMPHSIVNIVPMGYIDTFLKGAIKTSRMLTENCSRELNSAISEFRKEKAQA
ncbi:MAG: hypothetical protein ABR909_10580 [Candidatus Bathyarchaeia archaeon]|jgi:hypothetical protein